MDTAKVTLGITHASMGSHLYRNLWFSWDSIQVAKSLNDQPGILGFKVRSQWLFGSAWTFTVWQHSNDLDKFLASPQHRLAMTRSYAALQISRFLRLSIAASEVPDTWAEIEALFHHYAKGSADPSFRYREIHH